MSALMKIVPGGCPRLNQGSHIFVAYSRRIEAVCRQAGSRRSTLGDSGMEGIRSGECSGSLESVEDG
jgi:hypothetical protein